MLPENLVNTISQKPIKGFHPILVTDVFGFEDVLIRFLDFREDEASSTNHCWCQSSRVDYELSDALRTF